MVASFAEAWIENALKLQPPLVAIVASFAEAWIEKKIKHLLRQVLFVASFAEAWIENQRTGVRHVVSLSPPSRRRGLKTITPPL